MSRLSDSLVYLTVSFNSASLAKIKNKTIAGMHACMYVCVLGSAREAELVGGGGE